MMDALVPRVRAKHKKINVDDIANKAKREIAETNDVRELREIEERLGKLKQIVAGVTGKRADVNKIAVPMVRATIKGGRLLTQMVKDGTRQSRSQPKKNLISHSAILKPPTLKELGFSLSRAARWQRIGLVPDKQIDELEEKILESDDGVWSQSCLLKAAKVIELRMERRGYERRREKGSTTNDLKALIKAKKTFPVIYADPPWSFATYSEEGKLRSAERYYDTTSVDELKKLPIKKLAAKDSALFMWLMWMELPAALKLVKSWGFEYKTMAFFWLKTTSGGKPFTGMGYWTRANVEGCLIATRGNPIRIDKGVHQFVSARLGKHSEKPQEVRKRIERLLNGPYLELFGREYVEGWTVWGNEVSMQEAAE